MNQYRQEIKSNNNPNFISQHTDFLIRSISLINHTKQTKKFNELFGSFLKFLNDNNIRSMVGNDIVLMF